MNTAYCDTHSELATNWQAKSSKPIGKYHRQRVEQDYKQNYREVHQVTSDGKLFYQSKKWRDLVEKIKQRDGYRDGVDGKLLDDNDIIVDHIVRRDLLPETDWLDESNLWLLSRSQHQHKTNVEKKLLKAGRKSELKKYSKSYWKEILSK